MKKVSSHVIVFTITKGKVANYDGEGKLRNEVKNVQCSSLMEAKQCFDFHIGQQLINMEVTSILINGKGKGDKLSNEEKEAYEMVSSEVEKIMEPYTKKDVKENRPAMTEEAVTEISKNAISSFLESMGLSTEDIKEAAAAKAANQSEKTPEGNESDKGGNENQPGAAKKSTSKKPTQTS